MLLIFTSVTKFLTEASLGKREASFGLWRQKEQSTMVEEAQLNACENVKCFTVKWEAERLNHSWICHPRLSPSDLLPLAVTHITKVPIAFQNSTICRETDFQTYELVEEHFILKNNSGRKKTN